MFNNLHDDRLWNELFEWTLLTFLQSRLCQSYHITCLPYNVMSSNLNPLLHCPQYEYHVPSACWIAMDSWLHIIVFQSESFIALSSITICFTMVECCRYIVKQEANLIILWLLTFSIRNEHFCQCVYTYAKHRLVKYVCTFHKLPS